MTTARETLERRMVDLRSRLDTQTRSEDWAGVRETSTALRDTARELARLPREPEPATNIVGRPRVRG